MQYLAYACLLASTALGTSIVQRDTKTLVSTDVYNNISMYAGFTQQSSGSCSKLANGATLITAFNIPATDTQAVLWKFPKTKQIVVGIPGTASGQDFATDFSFLPVAYISMNVNCPFCTVHVGFLAAWNSLFGMLLPQLSKALKENPGYTTVVTGHSLGGAIAQLAFASLKGTEYKVEAAYTYGQPRPGNFAFASYIDGISGASDESPGTFYRVTHFNDGVPLLPPAILGFVQSRTEYWESADKPAGNTTFRCTGQESFACNRGQFGIGINEAHVSYDGFDLQCIS